MRRHFPVNILLILLLVVTAWASCLYLYDAKKMGDALAWRTAIMNGGTPYSWSFETPAHITGGHRIDEYDWNGATMGGGPFPSYFYLNLDGRYIDAGRYPLLWIRLFSNDEDVIKVFHYSLHETTIHYAPLIPVAEGWQTLLLDLEDIGWRGKPETSRGDNDSFESAWGSERGIVSVLRIDPPGKSVFEIDQIELLQRTGPGQVSGEIFSFKGRNDPLFERMREDPDRQWFIADDRRLRTPENAHWMRNAIARVFPSAIVFPSPPSENALTPVPSDERQTPYWLAALFLAALAAPFAARRLTGAVRPAVEAISLPVLFLSFVFLQPQLPTALAAAMGAAILAVIWQLSPKSVKPAVFGGRKAWIHLSPLLVISACAILFLPHRGTLDSPLREVLVIYFLWAMLQQYVIAVLFLERAKSFAGGSAVVVGAMAFSYLHFPNFALMILTFLLGLYLLNVYARHPNLPAIALAHAIAAVSIELVTPRWFWLSREVGPRFLEAL